MPLFIAWGVNLYSRSRRRLLLPGKTLNFSLVTREGSGVKLPFISLLDVKQERK
nr:MAG TPA: hypothetical protein [Caudoviricetes sp.]